MLIILVAVFRVMAPYSLVGDYKIFGTIYYLQQPDNSATKMEALDFFETLIATYKTILCANPHNKIFAMVKTKI
jgi:hypothetical protein